ncbi:S8 family serine peptidase [Rhizobium sp. YAF28]|uniref:S8 family peptidase n=1 Tax=Rhizobium sp. YAF28 TaxID=3233081 RepID=UPI003F9D242A
MSRTRIFVAVAWFIGPSLFGSEVQAQEPGEAAAITFDYRSGTISQEFLGWVAKYGARAPVKYDPNAKISDYVKMLCSDVASVNIQLFKQSLADQGVVVDSNDRVQQAEGGRLLLPPCLPVPSTTTVARVVLRDERFWDYYRQSGTAPSFKIDGIDSQSPTAVAADKGLSSALNGIADAIADEIAKGGLTGETTDVGYYVTERYLKQPGSSGKEQGEVAWDAFLAANALKRAGFDDDQIKKTVYASIDTASPKLKEGVDAALKRWSGANQLSSDEWTTLLADTSFDQNADFSKQVTWFDPSPSPKKDPAALKTGDIVAIPTTTMQSVQIPVDYASLSMSNPSEAAEFLKNNPPPSPTNDDSESKAEVTLLDAQPIDDIKAGTCDSATYRYWGTQAFAREFAAAAMRTRWLAFRMGVEKFEATIVVVDSGFVRANEEGAFRGALTQGGSLLHEQNPTTALGPKRAHGTIVAGLALGGPDLWGMAPALGLDVRITPATIFDVRMQNNVATPIFQVQWLKNAIGTGGDIFNISFAGKQQALTDAFRDYVGKTSSKLFIVAAGNNNLNDDVKGADINNTELYPQRLGGNDRGPNVIAVAAYDGKKLATFSNYSDLYVSIAAPGCAVASWAPSDDNSKYEERRVTGTSFSTPIVAHVAAIVKALMPQQFSEPRYVRARILAGADLTKEVTGVEDGRLLNPIKTVSLYEDVVEVETAGSRQLLIGSLQSNVTINELCEELGTPAGDVQLLKFARDPTPAGEKDSIVYIMRDGILDNSRTCKHKPGFLAFRTGTGEDVVLNLDDVVDMVLKVKKP